VVIFSRKKLLLGSLSQKNLDTKTILRGIKKVNRLYPGSGGLERPLEEFNLPINTKMGKEP
jgi:hypothetical protein